MTVYNSVISTERSVETPSQPENHTNQTIAKTSSIFSSIAHSGTQTIQSHTFASADIRDLLPLLDTNEKVKKVAVALFDFDDTLAMTGHAVANHLGGLKWREKLKEAIESLKKAGEVDKDAPLYEYLTLFIAKSARVKAVQSHIQPLIEKLDESGYVVMVFTARGRNGENAWYKLNINGIDALTEEQMENAEIHLQPIPSLKSHDKIYKNIMIFSQNTPKDTLLSDLFSRKVLDPVMIRQLVFTDDKDDAVQKIKKVAKEYQVPYVGFHYTAVESMEKTEFDLLKSTIQLKSLFAKGAFLSQESVAQEAATLDKSLTPEDYFKSTIKQFHQNFVAHKLYRPFSTPDEFQKAVSEGFKSSIKN